MFLFSTTSSLAAHEFYRVPYTDVQDLVRSRKVFKSGSGAHPASYPLSTGGFPPGVLRSGREAEIQLP
jgi:hypothetical protein